MEAAQGWCDHLQALLDAPDAELPTGWGWPLYVSTGQLTYNQRLLTTRVLECAQLLVRRAGFPSVVHQATCLALLPVIKSACGLPPRKEPVQSSGKHSKRRDARLKRQRLARLPRLGPGPARPRTYPKCTGKHRSRVPSTSPSPTHPPHCYTSPTFDPSSPFPLPGPRRHRRDVQHPGCWPQRRRKRWARAGAQQGVEVPPVATRQGVGVLGLRLGTLAACLGAEGVSVDFSAVEGLQGLHFSVKSDFRVRMGLGGVLSGISSEDGSDAAKQLGLGVGKRLAWGVGQFCEGFCVEDRVEGVFRVWEAAEQLMCFVGYRVRVDVARGGGGGAAGRARAPLEPGVPVPLEAPRPPGEVLGSMMSP